MAGLISTPFSITYSIVQQTVLQKISEEKVSIYLKGMESSSYYQGSDADLVTYVILHNQRLKVIYNNVSDTMPLGMRCI